MRTLAAFLGFVRGLLIVGQIALAPSAALAQIGPLPGMGPLPIGLFVIGVPQSLGSVNSSGTASSYTITTGAAVNSGDALVISALVWHSGGSQPNVTGISDGTNSYTFANRATGPGFNSNNEIWYVCGAAAMASGATITITLAGNATSLSATASRTSGILPSSCLDANPTPVTGGSSAGGTITTPSLSKTNEIVFGSAIVNACPTYTQASGFTDTSSLLCNSTNFMLDLAYQKVSSTTAVSYSPSWTPSEAFALVAISLKGF